MEKESEIRKQDSIASVSTPTQPTTQCFNFFQINPPQRSDEKLSWRVSKTEESLELLADQWEEEFFTRSIESVYAEIDSINILASEMANIDVPTNQDREKINSLNQYRADLSQKADSLTLRRTLINERIQKRSNRLDSLNSVEFKEAIGQDTSFDTVLFNQNFREFYAQLNGALIQNDNWRQLSRTFENPDPLASGPIFPGQSSDPDTYIYPYSQSQRFYKSQPGQTQSPNLYSDTQPDPWEQNIYVQSDPSTRGKNTRYPTEFRQSRYTTIYQPEQQEPNWYRQNQRSNTFAPVFIPRIGVNDEAVDEPSPTNDSLQVQPTINNITEEYSGRLDSLNREIPMDSTWQTRVDTLFLDKEIIIGLPNSKKEVYFGINRDQLEESEKQKLESVVAILEAQPVFI